MRLAVWAAAIPISLSVACGGDDSPNPFEQSSGTTDGTATGATGSTGDAGATGSTGAESTGQSDFKLDVGGWHDLGPGAGLDVCQIGDDQGGGVPCEVQAPADSFAPEVQWTWGVGTEGDPEQKNIPSTPLVANMTDDNGDGVIDLCDTPDVIVAAYGQDGNGGYNGRFYVLDGATGSLHFEIPDMINTSTETALGDIDGDGKPELIAQMPLVFEEPEPLIAFENDGTVKWLSDEAVPGIGVSLADLDNDGDTEVLFGAAVFDHEGHLIWHDEDAEQQAINSYSWGSLLPTAADLDGDGDLEVIAGSRAYHHDGTIYYDANIGGGTPHVANLDDDPDPEILIAGMGDSGISILEHDGTVKVQNFEPIADVWWWSPAAIHDINGDGSPEILMSSQHRYHALRPDLSIMWSAEILDSSGLAAGTAFDFLGDAQAEAIYGDETRLHVFDQGGATVFTEPRKSWTGIEFPVVADVDNDGSAEIIVVSNRAWGNSGPGPYNHTPVTVFRDADDRWIPARRIWNQHAYHVTNINEDGTIPKFEPPSWKHLNTFRTNAQVEAGSVCNPQPAG